LSAVLWFPKWLVGFFFEVTDLDLVALFPSVEVSHQSMCDDVPVTDGVANQYDVRGEINRRTWFFGDRDNRSFDANPTLLQGKHRLFCLVKCLYEPGKSQQREDFAPKRKALSYGA
jgi:hypothetical protein